MIGHAWKGPKRLTEFLFVENWIPHLSDTRMGNEGFGTHINSVDIEFIRFLQENQCLEWQKKTGHITDYISQDFPDASGTAAYLCGNMSMTEEITNMLISRGLVKEKIYTEKF